MTNELSSDQFCSTTRTRGKRHLGRKEGKKNQQNIHFHQEKTKSLFHQKENKIIVSATRLSYKQNEKVIIKAKYSNNYNRLVFIHGGRKKK